MKAKKSSPKSIRFNIKDLELALAKSELESIQELVDWLLKDYVRGYKIEKSDIQDYKKPVKNYKGRNNQEESNIEYSDEFDDMHNVNPNF